ncbi:hypothetical protein PASE110613_07185 [Paenibacillus sediminis]|uniref:mRNA-degrading endonuclease RelE of RelBE toxin-antitoxin system n=1 Tax=Paenibacillus sediminis TaxID=664909 RepID=A0ABS4H215_9BACL|nr:mRNA-degrading endonuclease RelE of RelBE toxin-antitoxin system [Paenibacillus sediminis]
MNSKYNIKFSSDAEKTLVKLDKTIARRIFMALEQLVAIHLKTQIQRK